MGFFFRRLGHHVFLRWAIRYSLLSCWPTCVPRTCRAFLVASKNWKKIVQPWRTWGDRNGVIAGEWKEAFASFALVSMALPLPNLRKDFFYMFCLDILIQVWVELLKLCVKSSWKTKILAVCTVALHLQILLNLLLFVLCVCLIKTWYAVLFHASRCVGVWVGDIPSYFLPIRRSWHLVVQLQRFKHLDIAGSCFIFIFKLFHCFTNFTNFNISVF